MRQTLKKGQQLAFEKLNNFVRNDEAKVFILKGYAGTGKTTMMKVFKEELDRKHLSYSLLASTGRAAKILSNATGSTTKTVHVEIYKYEDFNQDLEEVINKRNSPVVDDTGQILIQFGVEKISRNGWYYIIDESSMLSDWEDKLATQALFGSGRLLKDLLEYDPKGKFIFVGDACQLPPVQQDEQDDISPALSVEYFKKVFNIHAEEVELTEIIRQEKGNDIILSAKRIRNLYNNPPHAKWAKFPFAGYKNIHLVNSEAELIKNISEMLKRMDTITLPFLVIPISSAIF